MKCPHCQQETGDVDFSGLRQQVNLDNACWHVEEVGPLPMSQKAKNRFYNHRDLAVNRPVLVMVTAAALAEKL